MRRVGTNGLRLALCVALSLVMVLSGIPTQALDAAADGSAATNESADNTGTGSDGGNGGGTASGGTDGGTFVTSNTTDGSNGLQGGQNGSNPGQTIGDSSTSQGGGSAGSGNADTPSAGNDETPSEGQPLDLSGYITGATMYYISSSGEHVMLTDNATIPDGVTSFEVTASFANIPSQELKNRHGSSVTFALPSVLTNASVAGSKVYDSQNNEVGTIQVSNNTIIITFYDSHLEGDENARTSGSFTFSCGIDRSGGADPEEVRIGDITIPLHFQTRTVAETGSLTVEKSNPKYIAITTRDDKGNASTDPNAGYLEYTLTVNTGEQAMPSVRVEDVMNGGDDKPISGYLVAGTLLDSADNATSTLTTIEGNPLAAGQKVAVVAVDGTPNGTVSVNDKTHMTWTIGDMGAYETRTLTYRVKVNDYYVGLYKSDGLSNTATVYSETYARGSKTSNFTPHVHAVVNKTVGEVADEGNTIKIPHTITIAADSDNTWTIRNLKIADNLGRSYGSGDSASSTNDSVFQAMNAQTNGTQNVTFTNFQVYEQASDGTETPITISAKHNNAKGQVADNPEIHYGNDSLYNPRFDMYVGDAQPGRSLVLTYDVVVKKELFTELSSAWNINNSVTVNADDTRAYSKYGGNAEVGKDTSDYSLGTQVWDRKASGKQTTQETVQTISDGQTTTIPTGAVRYQVVVNEAGQWNVSQATLTDSLGPNMHYVGYLQIDRYAGASGIATDASVDAAISALGAPTDTKYIDLSTRESSFTATLASLGFEDKPGAYVLTYYAVPTDTASSSMATIRATNTFSLSGSVTGPGASSPITMAKSSTVSVSDVINGKSKFKVNKSAWYFDYSQGSQGKAYWVLTATGAQANQNLALRDVTEDKTNNINPQVVAAYVGYAGSDGYLTTDAYSNLSELQSMAASTGLTALERDVDYTVDGGTITFLRSIELGESKRLYVITSTDRSLDDPVSKGGVYTLRNKVQVKEATEDEFRDAGEASLATVGGGNIYKELGQVLTRNSAGTWRVVESGSGTGGSDVLADKAMQAGTYIDWRIKVNAASGLSGAISVLDSLPDGVEPVYVRYLSSGSGAMGSGAPTMPQVSGLGGSWQDIGVGNSGNGDSAHAYYNSDTRQIRFEVGNLQRVSAYDSGTYFSSLRTKSLEIQVLVRVTDESVLYGSSSTSETFTNTVSATDSNNVSIGQDTSAVKVNGSSLSKGTTTDGKVSQGTLPFQITVNPLGERLGGDDTLTVVDELASPLGFNLDTVKVTNATGQDVTSSITIKDGGTTEEGGTRLLFELPNGAPFTISYKTVLHVQPNQQFSYQNKAYWYGHDGGGSTSSGTAVNSVSATSDTERSPSITVTKRDAEDVLAAPLPGAKFALQKVTWDADANDGAGDWAEEGDATTRTTGIAGTATFSGLEYNTAYRLTEVNAPDGYALDTTPQYVVVGQSTSNDAYHPSYPGNVATYAAHGATASYVGSSVSVEVADEHATTDITATKKWDDGNNQDGIRPDEVQLTLTGKVGDKVVSTDTQSVNANSDWSNTWANVPMLHDGQLISYSVSETPTKVITGTDGPGTYATDVTGDVASGFVVTNTHTPQTTSVTATKRWEDNHNSDGLRPESVQLTLTGKVGDEEVYSNTRTLTAGDATGDDTWACTWNDLPAYHNGTKILYTLSEAQDGVVTGVDGPSTYKSEVSGEAIFGFTVTNTHTPETPTVPKVPDNHKTSGGLNGSRSGTGTGTSVAPASVASGNGPSSPGTLAQTGDTPWPEAVGGLLLAALVSAGIGITLKRREKRS